MIKNILLLHFMAIRLLNANGKSCVHFQKTLAIKNNLPVVVRLYHFIRNQYNFGGIPCGEIKTIFQAFPS